MTSGRDPRPPHPPPLAGWLLERLLPRSYRDETMGDLAEAYRRRSSHPRRARLWYWRHVLLCIPGALRLRVQTRHDTRPRSGTTMESIRQDLRYGLRSLIKSPGFAVVSTLTLALAIGLNTSIFSLVSVIIFADLPMRDTESVQIVRGTNPALDITRNSVSPGDFLELRERARSFESMSALTEDQWVLTGADQPVRVSGLSVSAGLLENWHLPPILGRGFAEGEDRAGADAVAMLTHGFWQRQYGGRTDVIGETIRLDGREYTIVGVTDPGLEFASFADADVLTPLVLNRAQPNHSSRYLFVVGRLAPGATHAQASEEVRRIGEELEQEFPADNAGWGLWSAPAMESLIDEDGQTIMILLQLAVGMVILIACANVANMLLARATTRAREIAVRSALGAMRGRLVRQLLTESLVISLAAAALGLVFAAALNDALVRISAGTEEVFMMAVFDTRVLLFTLLVSLVAPMFFGLLPALRSSSAGPAGVLRDGRSSDGGRSGKRARSALVMAQVALAVALMVLGGLLTRTVINLHSRPLGIDPSNLLSVELDLPDSDYPEPEQRRAFYDRVRSAMARVPGVEGAELTNVIPGADFGAGRSISIEGREIVPGVAQPTVGVATVSAGYFDLVGLNVLSGRGLEEQDDESSFNVAVISREVAERHWPGEDPVGRRFKVGASEEFTQVVGVVSDVRAVTQSERPAPNIYVPHGQDPRAAMYLVTRTDREVGSLAGPIRDAVWSIDADLPVDAIRTFERANYESRASDFALITLFVTFALFALAMAAIGLYGVMSYAVSQRKSEIGLRMALGAEVGSVRWMIVGQGVKLLGGGLALGLLAAFALSRLLGGLVFGVSTTDPLTFVGVPLTLTLVAVVANLVPAHRATRTDPARTLRSD